MKIKAYGKVNISLDVVGKREDGYHLLSMIMQNIDLYDEIEVDYLDQNFKPQHGKYTGWTAQIIQHEIDHCNGVVI